MNVSFKYVGLALLGLGLSICSSPRLHAGQSRDYQEFPAPYGGGLRELVDRTQSDLRSAADLEQNKDKQRERYHDAQGHLSTFDRKLTRGHFDKGELEKAIHSIRDILDHNVLQASTRDALMRDETDLKVARDRRY